MLDRLYQVLGGKTDVVSEKAFADDAKIGDWARGSVYAMRQTGIMQGKENNQSARRTATPQSSPL